MDKFLFMNYPEGDSRVQALDANCDSVEEITYTRRFSPEELRNQVIDEQITKFRELAPDIAIIEK